jgi:hypothetical protein
MRFNITISVDEDNLLTELYSIIDNRWANSPKIGGQQVAIIKNQIVNNHLEEAIASIDQMRKSMFDFDSLLADVSGIILSYQNKDQIADSEVVGEE